MNRFLVLGMVAASSLGWAACGGDDEPAEACTLGTADGCTEGQVCEAVTGSDTPACFAPVRIEGLVLDSADATGIGDARLVALDVNGFAVSDVVFSEADGSYVLPVPVDRAEDGTPVEASVTLRVAARAYQPFPEAPRTALPVDLSTAVKGDGAWVVENAATDVALIGLGGDTSGLVSIDGEVDAEVPGGVLVVAEQGGGAVATSVTDGSGRFTLYNVPPAMTRLTGYRSGLAVEPQEVDATADVEGVVLSGSTEGLATVSGSVSIVDASGGLTTSVILAVESTFDPNVARADAPAGLRAEMVGTAFTIGEVPPGRYVVLAAFENDELVRDPDTSIAGTEIVHIEVAQGEDVSLETGFKITEALDVVSPGAAGVEAIATSEPTFTWVDDSSEDGFELRVYDAFGSLVFEDTEVARVTGSETVDYTWTGTTLEPGMVYQFRVTSFRERTGGRTYISATEDLKGVFVYRP